MKLGPEHTYRIQALRKQGHSLMEARAIIEGDLMRYQLVMLDIAGERDKAIDEILKEIVEKLWPEPKP